MEYPGSWSINGDQDGFEEMATGINARAIDFAKYARLMLNQGLWGGKQIVSQAWVEQATQLEERPSSYYGDAPFFVTLSHYYKYFWWGSKRPGGRRTLMKRARISRAYNTRTSVSLFSLLASLVQMASSDDSD
jgi:CubicO group peptidase (beta-lactamase class C family)